MVRLLIDPNQVQSASEFRDIISPVALRRPQSSWQFLFRRAILELMPVDALAAHFHEVMGRPTKELYSVAGLLLIKEFMNWTNERTADSYMFDVSVQYALNLKPHQQSMCERTVERYNKLFREDELASKIMQQVTIKLVELLELDVSRQRLDSTHVQSNIAPSGKWVARKWAWEAVRSTVVAFLQLMNAESWIHLPSRWAVTCLLLLR